MVGPRLDPPIQLYRMREPHPVLRDKWKVTARFDIETIGGDKVRCVRMRHGLGPVRHYTEAALELMFERLTERDCQGCSHSLLQGIGRVCTHSNAAVKGKEGRAMAVYAKGPPGWCPLEKETDCERARTQ